MKSRALRRRSVLAALTVFTVNGARAALYGADGWPSHPITWIVPFPPGGVTDQSSRIVATGAAFLLEQPFVMENRPGVAGSLGTRIAARSAPDGYTVLYASTGPMAVNPWLYGDLGYEPLRDFTAIHGLARSDMVVAVPSGSAYQSLPELLQHARRTPGGLNMGSAGTGTGPHLAGELLQLVAAVQLNHVPYKGGAAALQDLLAERLDVLCEYPALVLPHIRSGRLRALASTGRHRLSVLPDTPSLDELGYGAAVSSTWAGLVVPAATPMRIVDRLEQAIHQTLAEPAVASALDALGVEQLADIDRVAFQKLLQTEFVKWREVVRRSGIAVR